MANDLYRCFSSNTCVGYSLGLFTPQREGWLFLGSWLLASTHPPIKSIACSVNEGESPFMWAWVRAITDNICFWLDSRLVTTVHLLASLLASCHAARALNYEGQGHQFIATPNSVDQLITRPHDIGWWMIIVKTCGWPTFQLQPI